MIQGPYSNSTKDCVKSIKDVFPGSNIIISTWLGSGAKNDQNGNIQIIESDDPGATVCRTDGVTLNNVNRQIVSTLNGLKAVRSKYVVKLRSDIRIKGRNFTNLSNIYMHRDRKYTLLRERVTGCQYYFRNPSIYPAPHHISDIFLFGRIEDLLEIWDIPLTIEPEFSQWYSCRERPKPDYDSRILFKFTPEQYIWMEALKKFNIDAKLTSIFTHDHYQIELSNKIIFNNFYMDSPKNLNIEWPARLKASFPMTVFRKRDFIYYYNLFCKKIQPSIIDNIKYKTVELLQIFLFKSHLNLVWLWRYIMRKK